jgi:hypothetical protein
MKPLCNVGSFFNSQVIDSNIKNICRRNKQMYNVKLSNYFYFPFFRQTPCSTGKWGDYQFHYQNITECDYWVVYDSLPAPEKVICPRSNTIFIASEPPSVKSYDPKFLEQFAIVIASHTHITQINHSYVLHMPLALPWLVNKDYDTLKRMPDIKKDRLISVIAGNRGVANHAQRLEFAYKLKKHFGNELDIFGRGVNEIADKWDAIARYKYHVTIENSVHSYYWSEKIGDAFLGFSYPIYYGCPNLADYFPVDSFTTIEIYDFADAARTIEKAISENYYERAKDQLMAARNLVLDKYNLFPLMSDLFSKMPVTSEKIQITIYPEGCFLR